MLTSTTQVIKCYDLVPVIMLSVEATPINPEPLPENEVAVETMTTTAPISGKEGDSFDLPL